MHNFTYDFRGQELIAILVSDYYKQCHPEQYDTRISQLAQYYTPRSTRIKEWAKVPVIGIQKWIHEELIDNFNKNFFNESLDYVLAQYEFVISRTLSPKLVNLERIKSLHNLGYLPLDIRALDEGTLCPITCPMIEVSATNSDFAWLVNNIETLELSELWYPMVAACVGIEYRTIANYWYNLTSDNPQFARRAFSDFGFRSLIGREGAEKASLGFLLSFNKTATIPAIWSIFQNYGDPLEEIAGGMPSTEHSVMCSGIALYVKDLKAGKYPEAIKLFAETYPGEEIDIKLIAEYLVIKRLLTEVYTEVSFSCVCDSYDYWSVVNKVLPLLKDEILMYDRTLYVRGDSGNPVQIVTDTVLDLYRIFGGTLNSKNYMVLDPHIRAIYGDGITQFRARKIFEILRFNEFSAENVALGIGGFSMIAKEESAVDPNNMTFSELIAVQDNKFQSFTRDTFGVAIKTTYGEYVYPSKPVNGVRTLLTEGFDIHKDPKTDDGLKKSQKGCCAVYQKPNGKLEWVDGLTFEEAHNNESNLLTPLFLDGKLLKEVTFNDIRNKFWNNQF